MKLEDQLWSRCKPKMIPNISDGDLETMMQIIKPVKDVGNGRFREILTEGVDRRGVAFTWESKLGRAVRLYRGGLNDIRILTFHTWAYYGFFKPTLAEAYACIRQFVPDWKLVRFFWLDSKDMDARNIIGDYHWCPCTLFGEEMTDTIDDYWTSFAQSCQEPKD